MSDRLTWEEIKQKYPDEWVAVVDVDWPDTSELCSGVVYAHSPDHKVLIEKQRHLSSAAVVWTGKKRGVAMLAGIDVDRVL